MPKLLYLVNEDWFFLSHFMPMARAARAAGYEIVIAARLRDHARQLKDQGFRVVSLESERRSLGPLEIVRTMSRIAGIVRAEQPDVVHCITLRMVMLGAVVSRLAGSALLVLAPTGLGHLWIEDGPIDRLIRRGTRIIVGRWLKGPNTRYVFENSEDPVEFGLDPSDPIVTLVGGAGVSSAMFLPAPEPDAPPLKVAVVARMLESKGIAESVSAITRARALGAPVELYLFGEPDPSNPRSFTEAELKAFGAAEGVHWQGPTDDVPRVWREHHVAMLLSAREGLPRSLVEAAAAGRTIIASDVTGCREVVRDGIEGLLVPLGNIEATARALIRLAENPALRARLGAAAHKRFCERFTEEAVRRTMEVFYRVIVMEAAMAAGSDRASADTARERGR